jgi:hypothetical protein
MEPTAQQLAEDLVEELFKLGSEPWAPCTRIQFIAGQYDMNERTMGGMAKEPLIKFFTSFFEQRGV